MAQEQQKVLYLPGFKFLGVTQESQGKVIIIRLKVTPDEYCSFSKHLQEILWTSDAEKKEMSRYLNMDESTKMILNAFIVANNALYFNDSSDYRSALWGVCEALNPSNYESYEPLFIDKE